MNALPKTNHYFQAPLTRSFFIHGLFVLGFLVMSFRPPWLKWDLQKKVDFEVIEYPTQASATMQIRPPQEIAKPKPIAEPRAVFGVSRKAITAESSQTDSAEVKQGNTVAKAEDNLQLDKSDVDQLPIPADDFLISSMPRLKAEVRIAYPDQAKKAGVEGPVVMDLLIDDTGRVRKVDLIKGPGFGLNEAALAVAQKFEFVPGRVGDRSVAVKIRYTYRFLLENR